MFLVPSASILTSTPITVTYIGAPDSVSNTTTTRTSVWNSIGAGSPNRLLVISSKFAMSQNANAVSATINSNAAVRDAYLRVLVSLFYYGDALFSCYDAVSTSVTSIVTFSATAGGAHASHLYILENVESQTPIDIIEISASGPASAPFPTTYTGNMDVTAGGAAILAANTELETASASGFSLDLRASGIVSASRWNMNGQYEAATTEANRAFTLNADDEFRGSGPNRVIVGASYR
jgi:hypothetical protein